MNKPSLIITIIVSLLLGVTVFAADERVGEPFQAIWDAIKKLEEQIVSIQFTPGPAGPPGADGISLVVKNKNQDAVGYFVSDSGGGSLVSAGPSHFITLWDPQLNAFVETDLISGVVAPHQILISRWFFVSNDCSGSPFLEMRRFYHIFGISPAIGMNKRYIVTEPNQFRPNVIPGSQWDPLARQCTLFSGGPLQLTEVTPIDLPRYEGPLTIGTK